MIAGAQDAGAEWWDTCLRSVGAVVPPAPPPRLHAFDGSFDRPWTGRHTERYAAYFPRPAGVLAADRAVGLLAQFWAPAVLRLAAPEARVLLVLRDPVDRLSAELGRLERSGRAITHREVAAAYGRGLYGQGVRRLMDAFPAERLLVLQLERCRDAPQAELARSLAFLGVEPGPGSGASMVGDLPPAPSDAREPGLRLSDDLRASLVDGYASDLERLATLCPDLDLDRWPTDLARRGG